MNIFNFNERYAISGWPLVFNKGVVVNLFDISESHLQSGDFYLILAKDKLTNQTQAGNLPSTNENLDLFVKFFARGTVHSFKVGAENFEDLFSEEFMHSVPLEMHQDVVLQNVLCSSNRGISLRSCQYPMPKYPNIHNILIFGTLG